MPPTTALERAIRYGDLFVPYAIGRAAATLDIQLPDPDDPKRLYQALATVLERLNAVVGGRRYNDPHTFEDLAGAGFEPLGGQSWEEGKNYAAVVADNSGPFKLWLATFSGADGLNPVAVPSDQVLFLWNSREGFDALNHVAEPTRRFHRMDPTRPVVTQGSIVEIQPPLA